MRFIDMTDSQKAKVWNRHHATVRASAVKNAEAMKLTAQRLATEYALMYAERECNGDASGRLARRMRDRKNEVEAIVQQLAGVGIEFSPHYSIA